MTDDHRTPQAFILKDDKHADETVRKVKNAKGTTATLTLEPDLPQELVSVPVSATPRPRSWRFATLMVSALTALFMMWLGLTITQMVEAFFARSPTLGWIATILMAIAGLAAIGIIVREIWGLFRLRQIELLQDHSARALNLKDRQSATTALNELVGLYDRDPAASQALAQLAQHQHTIMNAEDRLKLADRLLLEPRDAQARKMIASRARRVTLLTTVTPAAALDILFVATQNLMMLREIATLYGGRPSTLSTLKIARMVATHLAVTGGLALSDSLVQHIVGKGLLGRLSARFGEGAVNGILTTRIGLAACKLCRPIPKSEEDQDRLTGMVRELLKVKNDGSPQP